MSLFYLIFFTMRILILSFFNRVSSIFFLTESCDIIHTVSQISNHHIYESTHIPGARFEMRVPIAESCINE